MVSPTPAETCQADCLRKRAEQSLQAAIKTLRKSISRQHFSVQLAGTEYEVAQRPSKALEGQGACVTGQVLQDGKCGESLSTATQMSTANLLCPFHPQPGETAREGDRPGGDKEASYTHHSGCHSKSAPLAPGPGQGSHWVSVYTCDPAHSPEEGWDRESRPAGPQWRGVRSTGTSPCG